MLAYYSGFEISSVGLTLAKSDGCNLSVLLTFSHTKQRRAVFPAEKYNLNLPLAISSHLSSCHSWWSIWGGKSCYIDREYVNYASLDNLVS